MSEVDSFISKLVKSNKSHNFFSEWDKIKVYREFYKDELALLSVLHDSNDAESELYRLIKTYPKINSLVPLLTGVRPKQKKKSETPSLVVLDDSGTEDIHYYFASENISDAEIYKTIDFAKKTGLLNELVTVRDFYDYYFGVEVGLDSNARKNRSGKAMEKLVEPYVRELTVKHDGEYLAQKTFKFAAKVFNVDYPKNQANKKGDFMILINGKPINVEVNFFDDGGSKQEIMNSYIPRAENLRKAGWGFALVTDGMGWISNRAQIKLGYETIGNIYNLNMCAEGKLEEITKKL